MAKTTDITSFAGKIIEIWPQVMRGFMRAQTDALAQGKITEPQYFVLDLIVTRGSIKMSKLAAALCVSLPAMSGLINRLHKMKLVKRVYPEKDRRVIRIEITTGGRNVVNTITVQRMAGIKKIFSQLPKQDRKEYLRIVTKIKNILYKNIKR